LLRYQGQGCLFDPLESASTSLLLGSHQASFVHGVWPG